MSNYYNAFEISPVPDPAADAVAPEPFRGIYGMPMFVTVPTIDLVASERFWSEGLGFFNLFSVPDQLLHLRRWAFQDVLLVPSTETNEVLPAATVSFACVLSEIDAIATACEAVLPGCTTAPRHTPWNSVELAIDTPEKLRVIFSAAKPFDQASRETRNLADIGIHRPEPPRDH